MGGTAAGPLIYATGMDLRGAYTEALWCTAVLAIVIAVIVAVMDDEKLSVAYKRA